MAREKQAAKGRDQSDKITASVSSDAKRSDVPSVEGESVGQGSAKKVSNGNGRPLTVARSEFSDVELVSVAEEKNRSVGNQKSQSSKAPQSVVSDADGLDYTVSVASPGKPPEAPTLSDRDLPSAIDQMTTEASPSDKTTEVVDEVSQKMGAGLDSSTPDSQQQAPLTTAEVETAAAELEEPMAVQIAKALAAMPDRPERPAPQKSEQIQKAEPVERAKLARGDEHAVETTESSPQEDKPLNEAAVPLARRSETGSDQAAPSVKGSEAPVQASSPKASKEPSSAKVSGIRDADTVDVVHKTKMEGVEPPSLTDKSVEANMQPSNETGIYMEISEPPAIEKSAPPMDNSTDEKGVSIKLPADLRTVEAAIEEGGVVVNESKQEEATMHERERPSLDDLDREAVLARIQQSKSREQAKTDALVNPFAMDEPSEENDGAVSSSSEAKASTPLVDLVENMVKPQRSSQKSEPESVQTPESVMLESRENQPESTEAALPVSPVGDAEERVAAAEPGRVNRLTAQHAVPGRQKKNLAFVFSDEDDGLVMGTVSPPVADTVLDDNLSADDNHDGSEAAASKSEQEKIVNRDQPGAAPRRRLGLDIPPSFLGESEDRGDVKVRKRPVGEALLGLPEQSAEEGEAENGSVSRRRPFREVRTSPYRQDREVARLMPDHRGGLGTLVEQADSESKRINLGQDAQRALSDKEQNRKEEQQKPVEQVADSGLVEGEPEDPNGLAKRKVIRPKKAVPQGSDVAGDSESSAEVTSPSVLETAPIEPIKVKESVKKRDVAKKVTKTAPTSPVTPKPAPPLFREVSAPKETGLWGEDNARVKNPEASQAISAAKLKKSKDQDKKSAVASQRPIAAPVQAAAPMKSATESVAKKTKPTTPAKSVATKSKTATPTKSVATKTKTAASAKLVITKSKPATPAKSVASK
ncbi:MAG: hypothetical protein HQL50_15065, partial [Magnetococcales bacterium]|nr:hypothetical protein [Magnetococcales bacterium]